MADAAELILRLVGKDETGKALEGIGAKLKTVGVAGAAALGVVGAAAIGITSDIRGAQNEFQTQLGVSADKARELGAVAKDVYGNNFSGSVKDAASTISTAFKVMGDVGREELGQIAENAFRLQDAFGVDTTQGIDAAKTLMENFGLSSKGAFDFIAAGYQQGLNRSGDFLDTINEYSTQFKSGGADASQFFSLLESGMQGGMLGTDKAADAFKEFRVRITDGSKATGEAILQLMGMQTDAFMEQVATGQLTTAEAFTMVLDKLGEVEEEGQRMQIGVGLLGTQFEDLGTDAALALSFTSEKLAETEGAAASLDAQYQTFGNTLETWKRTALLAMAPFAEQVGTALPLVGSFGMALTGLGPITAGLAPAFKTLSAVAVTSLRAMGIAMLTPPLGFVVALVAAGVAGYLFRDQIVDGIGAAKDFVVGAFGTVKQFLSDNWREILSIALLFLAGPYGLVALFSTNAFGIRDTVKDAIGQIPGIISGLAGQAASAGMSFGRSLANGVIRGINSLLNRLSGTELIPAISAPLLGQITPAVRLPSLGQIPEFRLGHPFIPSDNFPALLHRGERVLTAAENRQLTTGPTIVNIYLDSELIAVRVEERQSRQLQAAALGV